MKDKPQEQQVKAIGHRIFRETLKIRGKLRERLKLASLLMKWAMKNEQTKVKILHFIDVLPTLSDKGVVEHLGEYFPVSDYKLPFILRFLSLLGTGFGSIPLLGPLAVAAVTTSLVQRIANSFIAGATAKDILKVINELCKKKETNTLDVLGEKVQSEEEARVYLKTYLDLTEALAQGDNISLKPSSLYSEFSSVDPEGTKQAVKQNLYQLLRKAKQKGLTVNIDMEHHEFKDIILELFAETLEEEEFKDLDDFGTVIQAYLKDSDEDLENIIKLAEKLNRRPYVRLVKGAYWEYEMIVANDRGWPVPVFQTKSETDRNYEKLARMLLWRRKQTPKGLKCIRPAFGSHNIRSIAYVIAYAEELGLPKDEYEFQLLYGMGDAIALALVNMGSRVRIYTPQGELLSGMAYLVRRILENTSSESFLRHLYLEAADVRELLEIPGERGEEEQERGKPKAKPIAKRTATALERHATRILDVTKKHRHVKEAQILQSYAERLLILQNNASNRVVSTGAEENQYLYIPRGRGIVIIDREISSSEFVGIIAAPLVAGNEVLVCANRNEHKHSVETFNNLLRNAGLKSLLEFQDKMELAETDVLGYDWVFFVGPNEREWEIRKLAGVTAKDQRSVKKVITQVSPDYLKEFLLPRTVTINLMRKGFAPEFEEARASGKFRNIPPVDFCIKENHQMMDKALEEVESQIDNGEPTYSLVIDGGKVIPKGKEVLRSVNPAKPEQIVGTVYKAGIREAKLAIMAAKSALSKWKNISAKERANYLRRAGKIMQRRRFELAAWMILEMGKVRLEALGDVDEAIDYLFYYAEQMERLAKEDEEWAVRGWRRLPRGVSVVISPWNFPLAILTGMTAAAVVTGNTVIMKPAEQSPIIAAKLMEVFEEAQLPAGVVNYLPGIGEEVGPYLVKHPEVGLIDFTGSEKVGLNINEQCSRIQREVAKAVIAEMGGKNAVIIDESADLDETISGVVASFLGYSNQKCSACSRAIVHQSRYDEFIRRLKSRVESLKIGEPKGRGTAFGPLIDMEAKEKVERFIAQGDDAVRQAKGKHPKQMEDKMTRLELKIADLPEKGYFIKPVIYTNVPPNIFLAQEEIFGPVLCVIKAKHLKEALDIANQTRYGLTGGVYSRTPSHIEEAIEKFMVGNLYINRKITGALVGRQPFGGFFHSGIGSKAGGPDYLSQFTQWEEFSEGRARTNAARKPAFRRL